MMLNPSNYASALAHHPLLDGVPDDIIQQLARHARWLEAEPGQIVVDVEDLTTDVYFVVQGAVRVLVPAARGDRAQILGDFKAGTLLGEIAAIDHAPRSARIEALVRTCLCRIPSSVFLDLAVTSRPVLLRLLELLTTRIRGQTRRLLEHDVLPIRLRLASELLRMSHPRADGTSALSPPPTQEELAARIGSSRESVSRELGCLMREGLVHRSRAALVLDDPAALRAVVAAGFDA